MIQNTSQLTARKITLITFVLGLLSSFAPFSVDMYLSALPALADSFHTDIENAQLTLSSFFFGLAIGQLFYGPLIDRFGRRRLLLGGVGLYCVTSLLCIFVSTIEGFIALRFMQAVGGCAGMIITRAIIRDLFDESRSAHALSMIMLIQGMGPVLAPVMGSYILHYYSWKAIFIFLSFLGFVSVLLTFWSIPETLPVEKRSKHKLLHVFKIFKSLLSDRKFIVPTLSISFAFAIIFIYISASSFVFMEMFELSKTQYAWLFAMNAMGMIVFNKVNTILLKHFKPRQLFVSAIGFETIFSLALLAAGLIGQLWFIMLCLFFCVAIMPIIGANGVAVAMANSGKYAGSASSLMGVFQFSIASLVSLIASFLHDGTAVPMTGLIFLSALMALFMLLFAPKGWLKSKRVPVKNMEETLGF